MNKQILQMKYHPAKKEVEFHRFQNGKEIPIRNDSRLMKYMNLKGKFILQDYGNDFFDDIATTFDGLKSIDIEVITTKIDYEDFEQMVEFYNQEINNTKINSKLIEELPSMEQIFSEVKKYGENAIQILEYQRRNLLLDIPFESESAKKSAENFSMEINKEINNIKEKIEDLQDNNISLCFTGVYSSGKSALINSILGYKILPENIMSETAKMFKIYSPKRNENVKIKFEICGVPSELEWNNSLQCFEFIKGPSENNFRTEIQELINTIKQNNSPQYEQIKKILKKINSIQEISAQINILFPIPLDRENVQFTIYDTPGTDSNYKEHQYALNKALEEQTKSILIFVAKPDGLEGTGNNALLNYLKEMEEKNSKTSIDISRSLFVINKADSQIATERETLQHQQIKNKDDKEFSINLANKKLFFTSARYAYAAKAISNGIETEEERGIFGLGKSLLASEQSPMAYCYKQNKCATSEYATKRMIDDCENELKKAKEKNDDTRMMMICSGLYALEREIIKYGEKYSSSVKAFAIIDSVNKALNKLQNKANSLQQTNKDKINDINRNIQEIKNAINGPIENKYKSMIIAKDDSLPEEIRERLELDKVILNDTLVKGILTDVNKKLKKKLISRKIKFKESHINMIDKLVAMEVNEFTKRFEKQRLELLTSKRDEFMEFTKNTIKENGNISESAKQYFLNIPNPQIPQFNKINGLDKIYDSHRISKKFIFKSEYLDKDGFLKDLDYELVKISNNIMNTYKEDYIKTLDKILYSIKDDFEYHLEDYSLSIKAMYEDKNAMIELGERILKSSQSLIQCQNDLNQIIWNKLSKESDKIIHETQTMA